MRKGIWSHQEQQLKDAVSRPCENGRNGLLILIMFLVRSGTASFPVSGPRRSFQRRLRNRSCAGGRLPDAVACVIRFQCHWCVLPFIGHKSVQLVGCEAAGRGVDTLTRRQLLLPVNWVFSWHEIILLPGRVRADCLFIPFQQA